jgi:formate-dependent nitrite reductase membrane component NrfD
MWNSQVSGVGHHAGHSGSKSFEFDREKTLNLPKESKIDNEIKQTARRVYDAPNKGILWGWEVAGYIFTKAIAAGIIALPFLFQLTGLVKVEDSVLFTVAIFSLLFLGLTGILLIKDLDQPKRFLYVLLRPNWSSWLVKGGYTITAFGGLVTLWCVLKYFDFTIIADLIVWPIIILSVLLAIYTAFLFGQAKGRDFWQSPLLSVHMLLHAVVGGSAALLVISPFWPDILPLITLLKGILFWSLVIQLLSFAAEFLSSHPTEDAGKTAHSITHGKFRNAFWGGVVLLGNAIPLMLLTGSSGLIVVATAAALVLVGVWLSVRIWVLAPQMLPLS